MTTTQLLADADNRQQWRSFANGAMLDFDAMARDMRYGAGMSLEQAKTELRNSKVGDVFLDSVRIA